MPSAHLLELPQQMDYDAALYAAVNTTMYRYFAIVVVSTPSGRSSRRSCWLSSCSALVLGFVTWLTLVEPVYTQIAAALQNSPTTTVPAPWVSPEGQLLTLGRIEPPPSRDHDSRSFREKR